MAPFPYSHDLTRPHCYRTQKHTLPVCALSNAMGVRGKITNLTRGTALYATLFRMIRSMPAALTKPTYVEQSDKQYGCGGHPAPMSSHSSGSFTK